MCIYIYIYIHIYIYTHIYTRREGDPGGRGGGGRAEMSEWGRARGADVARCDVVQCAGAHGGTYERAR